MPRLKAPSRNIKKLPSAPGRDRAREEPRSGRNRDLVRRRSAHWAEEQDHAALGQTRHEAFGPHDQRTASTYIFGAICPKEGKGAGLVLPLCNVEAMNLHLAEIATEVGPGAHALLMVDQAGWHMSSRLIVPPNITLVPLPPKCPELNPTETSGSSCETTGYPTEYSNPTTILSTTVARLEQLIDQPWRIMSIGTREWAHRS